MPENKSNVIIKAEESNNMRVYTSLKASRQE